METPETRIVYAGTVQALFHIALRGRLTASARGAIREAGLDLDQELLPAYAVTTWVRCLELALRDVWPELERDEAYRRLGHALVEGLMGTLLGRTLAAAARALGPRHGMGQLNRALRGSNNYVESRYRELSPTACELWINDILERPTYYQGLLEAALMVMGAREPRVEVLARQGRACTFHLQWAA